MKDRDECPVEGRFRLPYMYAADDAEKRMRRGQRQGYCSLCERWRWPDHQKACPNFTAHENTTQEGATT